MSKCACCHTAEREYLWQPCGPADNHLCFPFPGWQYRGYTSIPICEACKRKVEAGESVTFTHKQQRFTFSLVDGKAQFAVVLAAASAGAEAGKEQGG